MPVELLKAQENIPATNDFTIEGKVKSAYQFAITSSKEFKTSSLDSLVIYNHLMVKKRTIKNIKGILLKDILAKVDFDAASPKVMSEFFIVCVAADNYKVVFSWNELFNSAVGEHVLIVTESDGKKGNEMEDRIALLSAADHATGRRYVKGLQKIIIERVK